MANLGKFETLKKEFLQSLPSEKLNLLKDISSVSKCITDFIFRHTDQLDYIYENLNKPLYKREKLVSQALKLLEIPDEEVFIRELTFFKMKHFSRIVAKDIKKVHPLWELMEEYSFLADATFEVAYRRAYRKFQKIYGTPINQSNGNQAFGVVVSLGKLGGKELNYYSDVDVMYLYSDEGKTDKSGITNREFFDYVFSQTTRYLTKRNVEGQTWIVDLDLRPEGKKGFIAYSIPAVEIYYWTVGRTWERNMLIKARYTAGKEEVYSQFLSIIEPFVYRSIVGFEVIDEIVKMKRLIEEDAKRKSKEELDIKKMDGGIREIEFTVQVIQLLYGHKIPKLRERSTLKALRYIRELDLLEKEKVELLEEAYLFYRRLEHLIQIRDCVQTQKLKLKDADYYAHHLKMTKEEFLHRLTFYKDKVKEIFETVLPIEEQLSPIQKYLLTRHGEEEAIDYLKKLGFSEPKWALNLIRKMFTTKEYISMSSTWKDLFLEFIAELEIELGSFQDRESFLLNFYKLMVEGNMLRIFASALEQNRKLVEFILNITKSSDYITDILSKDPEILDFAFGVEDILKTKEDFEKELNLIRQDNLVEKLKKLKKIVEVLATLRYLSRIHEKDGLDRLRELNQILTNLADFILEKLYQYEGGKDFVIYALGKLGSKEMNIGSDLDLIFVFKDEKSKFEKFQIPQKLINDLTKPTSSGYLYQIDLRLRPYGRSGELAPSINYYKEYFEFDAREWERLAWTKARYITGDKDIYTEFEKILQEFLFGKDIDSRFIDSALEMRFKLEGLAQERSDEIDIKLGKGGIADIEFLVELFLLKHRLRQTNILEALFRCDSSLVPDYVFLREIEARLRMIKGEPMSKLKYNSKTFARIAHSFSLKPDVLWNKIQKTREKVRNKFIYKTKHM
ncbi:MAG: glutamine-synthetase adenylyltransferase [Aquificae bacterium]|nr:glutamine-synthetase adenylyltransferase [Aquificota bacterium]